MLRQSKYKTRGFTLVELAIVLAIAGLLFVGLWRLLSGGNQQLRDQAAAAQMEQLIAAVKAYLASGQDAFLQTTLAANPNSTALALPTSNTNNANCRGNIAANPGLCDFLPANFIDTTPNSYGQAYSIRVERNDATTPGTPPITYSFMIVTLNGEAIPDTSGGRISALIGGDGGFLYSNAVCGVPANEMACGAYGAWFLNITQPAPAGYGFGVEAVSGHIATRTFISPSSQSFFPWLARQPYPTLATMDVMWNTMTTDFFTGIKNDGTSADIYMAPSGAAAGVIGGTLFSHGGAIDMESATGQILMRGGTIDMSAATGVVHMQGGTINLQGGTISGNNNSTSRISLINLFGTPALNSPISVGSGCQKADPTDNSCPAAINVSPGDVTVDNLLSADSLYASTFIYQASDIRLKTNIQPIQNSLADIMKLKPVSYTLKESGKEGLGVIAQDLEKVYPQLVTKSETMKSVNYEGLIGPLIASVQELKKENDQLRKKVQEQVERTEKLERELKKTK